MTLFWIGFIIGLVLYTLLLCIVAFLSSAKIPECPALLRGKRCQLEVDHDGPHRTVHGTDLVWWN